MILKLSDFQSACKKILLAIDSNISAQSSDILSLKTVSHYLILAVTNREYYVEIKLDIDEEINFNATVDANKFLKLISQLSTETIELSIKDERTLIIKGNGRYKFPLIFDMDKVLELPKIDILNVTTTLDISRDILNSILLYNTKEFSKVEKEYAKVLKPVQTLYYIDEQGAITFNIGACVNKFELSKPIKLLFNQRLVKLFKLFNDDIINCKVGYDKFNSNIIQTKILLEDSNVKITSILSCNDTLLNSIPVDMIRKRAFDLYPYTINISKLLLESAIDRLLSLTDNNIGTFKFYSDYVELFNKDNSSFESLMYAKSLNNLTTYETKFDLKNLKLTLASCKEDYINFSFGNQQAAVISRASIYNIIPEIVG